MSRASCVRDRLPLVEFSDPPVEEPPREERESWSRTAVRWAALGLAFALAHWLLRAMRDGPVARFHDPRPFWTTCVVGTVALAVFALRSLRRSPSAKAEGALRKGLRLAAAAVLLVYAAFALLMILARGEESFLAMTTGRTEVRYLESDFALGEDVRVAVVSESRGLSSSRRKVVVLRRCIVECEFPVREIERGRDVTLRTMDSGRAVEVTILRDVGAPKDIEERFVVEP